MYLSLFNKLNQFYVIVLCYCITNYYKLVNRAQPEDYWYKTRNVLWNASEPNIYNIIPLVYDKFLLPHLRINIILLHWL